MSNILRKRRPTASGTGIEPTSCTHPRYHPILVTLMTPRSEEATVHRRDENAAGHCEGVSRRSSAPQIVFGGHQRAHQTLRCAFSSDVEPTPLTFLSQESKDVEDKLKDLIPWLVKLKDGAATASADDNHEEAKRREQLTLCVSCTLFLVDPRPNQPQIFGKHREKIPDVAGKGDGRSDPRQNPRLSSRHKARRGSSTSDPHLPGGRYREPSRLGRIDVFGVVIAAAIDRQPSRTVDGEFPPTAFTTNADGRQVIF